MEQILQLIKDNHRDRMDDTASVLERTPRLGLIMPHVVSSFLISLCSQNVKGRNEVYIVAVGHDISGGRVRVTRDHDNRKPHRCIMLYMSLLASIFCRSFCGCVVPCAAHQLKQGLVIVRRREYWIKCKNCQHEIGIIANVLGCSNISDIQG